MELEHVKPCLPVEGTCKTWLSSFIHSFRSESKCLEQEFWWTPILSIEMKCRKPTCRFKPVDWVREVRYIRHKKGRSILHKKEEGGLIVYIIDKYISVLESSRRFNEKQLSRIQYVTESIFNDITKILIYIFLSVIFRKTAFVVV